jgi:hypothetical protein
MLNGLQHITERLQRSIFCLKVVAPSEEGGQFSIPRGEEWDFDSASQSSFQSSAANELTIANLPKKSRFVVDGQNQNTTQPILASESLNRPMKNSQPVSNGANNNLSVGSIGEIKKGRFSVVESGTVKSIGQIDIPVLRDGTVKSIGQTDIPVLRDNNPIISDDVGTFVPIVLENKSPDSKTNDFKAPRRFTVSADSHINSSLSHSFADKKSRFDLGETVASRKLSFNFSKLFTSQFNCKPYKRFS